MRQVHGHHTPKVSFDPNSSAINQEGNSFLPIQQPLQPTSAERDQNQAQIYESNKQLSNASDGNAFQPKCKRSKQSKYRTIQKCEKVLCPTIITEVQREISNNAHHVSWQTQPKSVLKQALLSVQKKRGREPSENPNNYESLVPIQSSYLHASSSLVVSSNFPIQMNPYQEPNTHLYPIYYEYGTYSTIPAAYTSTPSTITYYPPTTSLNNFPQNEPFRLPGIESLLPQSEIITPPIKKLRQ